MTSADLQAVMEIAAVVHPSYPEDEAVFAERLSLAPEGCLVLADGQGALAGYLVSHPWPAGAVPALNSLLGELPAGTGNWYVHDLALLPAGRGTGAGAAAVQALASLARLHGCAGISLVAVGDSAGFWRRQGFRPIDEPALATKLASYDANARYMRCELN